MTTRVGVAALPGAPVGLPATPARVEAPETAEAPEKLALRGKVQQVARRRAKRAPGVTAVSRVRGVLRVARVAREVLAEPLTTGRCSIDRCGSSMSAARRLHSPSWA